MKHPPPFLSHSLQRHYIVKDFDVALSSGACFWHYKLRIRYPTVPEFQKGWHCDFLTRCFILAVSFTEFSTILNSSRAAPACWACSLWTSVIRLSSSFSLESHRKFSEFKYQIKEQVCWCKREPCQFKIVLGFQFPVPASAQLPFAGLWRRRWKAGVTFAFSDWISHAQPRPPQLTTKPPPSKSLFTSMALNSKTPSFLRIGQWHLQTPPDTSRASNCLMGQFSMCSCCLARLSPKFHIPGSCWIQAFFILELFETALH